MKQTIEKEWELEARRKLSNYWAGDWKILDDFISTLLKQQKQELKEKMFKGLVREEGHPIDKNFPIEEWETVSLKEVDRFIKLL